MKHFPVFLAVEGRKIVVSGAGAAALAKLRLLLKTEGKITVFGTSPHADIAKLGREGKLMVVERALEPGDAACAVLFYAANEDNAEDARVIKLAQSDGALTNWIDNLDASQFITPAIVDRDPVTVAIGTEGAAPVLARAIKADLEERLPRTLGTLARIGKTFRKTVEVLPMGKRRRAFWSEFYFGTGPKAFDQNGDIGVKTALEDLLAAHVGARKKEGHVSFVGAGPGDPELLTLKARRALHEADVVIHDRLVTPEILELARREAEIIDMGKEGFGPSTPQAEIDAMITAKALEGHHVVRLKSGDATVFGRLDEEMDACSAAGVNFSVVPGITSASAAVATIGQSLTRRGRNASVRLITGHDLNGFADQDWRALAKPGEVAAIYMGKRAARFLQGRMLMHGASPATPISVVENVSRPNQRVLATSLGILPEALIEAALEGPALILFGLAPRTTETHATDISEEIAL